MGLRQGFLVLCRETLEHICSKPFLLDFSHAHTKMLMTKISLNRMNNRERLGVGCRYTVTIISRIINTSRGKKETHIQSHHIIIVNTLRRLGKRNRDILQNQLVSSHPIKSRAKRENAPQSDSTKPTPFQFPSRQQPFAPLRSIQRVVHRSHHQAGSQSRA